MYVPGPTNVLADLTLVSELGRCKLFSSSIDMSQTSDYVFKQLSQQILVQCLRPRKTRHNAARRCSEEPALTMVPSSFYYYYY